MVADGHFQIISGYGITDIDGRSRVLIRVGYNVAYNLRHSLHIHSDHAFRNILFPDNSFRIRGSNYLPQHSRSFIGAVHCHLADIIQSGCKQIIYQILHLLRLALNSFNLSPQIFIFGLYRHNIANGIDAGDRRLQIMTELRHQFLLLTLQFILPLPGSLQFLAHDIKAFGKCTEHVILLHFKRAVQVSHSHSPRKALHLIERHQNPFSQINVKCTGRSYHQKKQDHSSCGKSVERSLILLCGSIRNSNRS